LRGAVLFEARLAGAELAGARLAGANLAGADLARAGLGRADLSGASLVSASLAGASLVGATLAGADLRMADLRGARARDADWTGADARQADLREAELEGGRVERASFEGADLREATLRGLRGFRRARWAGADIRGIDFTGAYLCRSLILDQNYLAEFRAQGPLAEVVYRVWWATSDCGRSILRWSAWTAALVGLYAWLFARVGVDYGEHPTWLSPVYFSVVTMTSLGFGDVVPHSVGGQIVTMLEVVTGYVMLGGLLSIFNNKMASRAD